MPLAVAVPDGAGSKINWVQGNHLGTPVATTDASGTAVTPTGYARIGFPGQVEQHADLYYNYYRDYDPTLGRYVQADPIGLEGDMNPYLYARGNPLSVIDPEGLQGNGKVSPRASVRRCLAPTQIWLQTGVIRACKANQIKTCTAMMSCQELQEQVSKRMACVTARERINSVCFSGGDAGHREQVHIEMNGVLKCQAIMTAKRCGCPVWR
jgi:RHS repeat-associated protein